jgi:hypothetical protein
MGKSYRIRTTPGEDKNIVVQVDQDFEQLEILSLKIRQQDVYDRMCSDYGIIAGRVFANRGYGIPNAKVSIFIPVSNEDAQNPVISAIYPFKTLEQTNEDGYRFNLLPYLPSYPGHIPTGTFPSRLDSVIDQTAIEIYDKYYKYTVTTNESGDYMIFGVPLGTQTIVMNVDLSDIGAFSLSPQDLIRMGMATEEQFDGPKFRSSPNFYELPQIIVINKTIDIQPFWGEPEVCRIGITRTDFDLSAEANVDIQPTAIFMGSVMSTNEKASLRANGASQKSTGELCKLITGPGEIIGITQTIFQDNNGLPVLRRAELPNGGKLIDANGTWLFDVPMNRDYVFTNEFGQQVISDDPNIGIPTKGKYRFKIKWQQSSNLNEDYKVGYYLVPNIRERGWTTSNVDPATLSPTTPEWNDFQKSYGFSLDWTGYTTGAISLSNRDIINAINCEDTFYEFDYNKVYTVAGLVDNYKIKDAKSSLIQNLIFNVNHRERFVGIKRIEDDTCEDTTNRYPVNDGVFRATLIWRVFDFLLVVFGIIGLILLVVYSLIAFLWKWAKEVLFALLIYWCLQEIISAIQGIVAAATPSVGFGATIWWAGVIYYIFMLAIWSFLTYVIIAAFFELQDYEFEPIRLPMLTYPDCDSCDCNGSGGDGGTTLSSGDNPSSSSNNAGGGMASPESDAVDYVYDWETNGYTFSAFTDCELVWDQNDTGPMIPLIIGLEIDKKVGKKKKAYKVTPKFTDRPGSNRRFFNNNLTLSEIINLYNVKANYYYNQKNACNSIGVRIEPSLNPVTNVHTDNVLVFLTPMEPDQLTPGTMYTFVNPILSKDTNNISGGTTGSSIKGITGTTNYLSQVVITYADPQSPNEQNFQTLYQLPVTAVTSDKYYMYKSDVEYYQVITSMTYSQFINLVPTNPTENSLGYILKSGETKITLIDHRGSDKEGDCGCGSCQSRWSKSEYQTPYKNYINATTRVVFLMRGVDPYSPKYETQISIDRILGYNTPYLNDASGWQFSITANLRLNIPIQNSNSTSNKHILPIHDNYTTNGSLDNQSDQYLFYPSYFFNPDQNKFIPFTTNLHKYYSALDFTKATYQVKIGDSNTELGSHVRFASDYGSDRDSRAIIRNSCSPNNITTNAFWENNLNNTYDKYNNQDSVAGGTFMFKGLFRFFSGCFVGKYGGPCRTGVNSIFDVIDTCKGWSDPTYFSFIYDDGINLSFNDPTRIVMRTDRLPSSSFLEVFQTGTTNPTLPNAKGENTTIFAQNRQFSIFIITDEGVLSIGGGVPVPQYGAGGTISGSNEFYGSVFSTFGCDGMVELDCYEQSGLNFSANPACSQGDVVENGCYVFVREPLTGLFKPKGNTDIDNWSEYIMRYRFFYGLCQGVFSTVFINNWVNGNLFAFSFKVDTFYNSLNEVSQRVYPKDVIVLQEDSNNFYYRSSPVQYSSLSSTIPRFIGSEGGQESDGQNTRNLKYPTTLLNLGPRDNSLKYLTMNSNFDGYNINQLPQTSYSDLSDMINFFSVIRLLDINFWAGLVGRNQLTKLFSRGNFKNAAKVDGDFAQSASVNSELGVIPFDSEYYASTGPNPSLISAEGYNRERMMGVYYYSPLDDIQMRDLISPMRIIRYKNISQNQFFYQNLAERSQIVPNYKWRIDNGGTTIFGTQRNTWATNSGVIRNGYRYQDLNRITSGYFSDGDLSNDTFYRGYIHAYEYGPKTQTSNTPTMLIPGNSYTILEYVSGDDFYGNNTVGATFEYTGVTSFNWTNGSKLFYEGKFLYTPKKSTPVVLVGAPWHFYFGVTKGATAINRFFTKYLGIQEFDEQ